MLRQRKRGPVTPGAGGGRRAGPFVQLDAADPMRRRSSAGMEGGGRGVLPAPKMNAPACSTKVSAFRAVHRLRTPPRIVGLFGPSVLAGVSLVAPYWIPCKCIPASAPHTLASSRPGSRCIPPSPFCSLLPHALSSGAKRPLSPSPTGQILSPAGFFPSEYPG